MDTLSGAVFVQTNETAANSVLAFARQDDGALSALGKYATGGRGNGTPHLPSQGSVVVDGGRLFVANAGSDDVSVFDIGTEAVSLIGVYSSGGASPRSIAVQGDLVYVLKGAPGSIAGFRLAADGSLTPIAGAQAPLSSEEADGAQIAFSPDGKTIVVTERVTDRIGTYVVRDDGTLDGPIAHPSSGTTPYGFAFAGDVLVVTEAFAGQVGAAAASSYVLKGGLAPVSASVQSSRSEVCWAAVSKDGRFAYVTNFGDGSISSYSIASDGSLELLDAVAATTRLGQKGLRDESLTADGRFLYALDADAQQIFGWQVADDGALVPVGAVDGLPATAAGLAAL
jgi:6-phosphogluconolactonase